MYTVSQGGGGRCRVHGESSSLIGAVAGHLIAFYFVLLFGWVFVCIRSSLHSVRFGQLLRCAHKCIVSIMKVYIERKNMQGKLIPFLTNINFIDVGN